MKDGDRDLIDELRDIPIKEAVERGLIAPDVYKTKEDYLSELRVIGESNE